MTFKCDGRGRSAVLALAFLGLLQSGVPFSAQAQARPVEKFEAAESLEGNYLAAVVAGAGRDLAAASAYLREAIKDDPQNSDLLERGFVAFLADGAMGDTFRAAEKLVQRDPSNGLAQLALGVRALKQKSYATARNQLQRGGRGRSADITATLLAAWAYSGSGDTKRALDTLERLRGESTFDRFRDFHAGLILDIAGRKSESTRRLKAAYEAERTNLRLVDIWARHQARAGDREAALATLNEFEQRVRPNHPVVRDALAKVGAKEPLPRIVASTQQGAAEVLYGLASAGILQGDEATALLYLRLAVYLDPSHDLAVLTLGDILERAKQSEDAVDVYRRMPENSALRPVADIQIGLGLETLGKTEEAVKHMEALIAARPDDVEAISALGNIYRSRKRFEEAADTYNKAIGKLASPGRSNWDLFYSRGISYERTKRWPEAEADLRKALELMPEALGRERALVLNYLGYSLVDRNLKLDEALGMLRRAVDLRPRDGYIIDSLGWAHYRLGRYDEAVVELERAMELRPSDPVINDHLGDVYWRTGRPLEARFQWNHARDLGPEPEDLEKILRKIEKGLDEAPPSASAAEPKKDGG
ncbi:tetratricopeptide repeat protein [Bosea sp. (in: a-proteobacteria)]|uniref:tetratricopeptide repeat protein n=1 Tax=Bosea sp. (in: a-proteobacteria) TaxID=1871050 RepID=UPI0025BF549A|nr:tetratricopeptide repeat protein [Bosea sp. (in: a-proteobacteria)]